MELKRIDNLKFETILGVMRNYPSGTNKYKEVYVRRDSWSETVWMSLYNGRLHAYTIDFQNKTIQRLTTMSPEERISIDDIMAEDWSIAVMYNTKN